MSMWRERQPQQLGTVQQPDGENLSVAAPGSDRRGCRVCTEPPEPAQIPGMELHRRPVGLPLPQHAHSLAEPVDCRLAQHNPHNTITHCKRRDNKQVNLSGAGREGR